MDESCGLRCLQVRLLRQQLAAKQAALAELNTVAEAAEASAAQNAALSAELAAGARQLAEQSQRAGALRDQVRLERGCSGRTWPHTTHIHLSLSSP